MIWFIDFEEIKLGISSNSVWHVNFKGSVRAISEAKDMIFLLPILEVGRQKIYDRLAELVQARKDIDAVGTFPETMLLKCAFELSVSDYWPLEGLKWLEASPGQLTDVFADTLAQLQKRSWATQRLKQKSKFALKKHQSSI